MSRTVFLKSVKQAGWKKFRVHSIAHYTVTCTGRSEAGDDLVLIQPFLLYHVISSKIYIRKGRRFVPKQAQPQPHVHSKARKLSPQLWNGLLELRPMSFCLLVFNAAVLVLSRNASPQERKRRGRSVAWRDNRPASPVLYQETHPFGIY